MGGGHVSRPDFGMPQPDPAHPLTEFYCLLQRALDREGVFALPALYAQFHAPARRIYADEAADFLTLLPDEEEGASRLLAPAQLQLLYSSLHVPPRCCSPKNAPGRYTPSSCCRPSSGKTRSRPCRTLRRR